MGAAAKWLHALYPSQATGTLRLRCQPLDEGPPEPPDNVERMEWVTSHAITLARFLRQLPELDNLELIMPLWAGKTSCAITVYR